MPRFANKSKNRKNSITRRLINKKKVLPTTTTSSTESSTSSFYTGPLDMTYISDEIFVAGYPWNRRTEKRIRRNNVDEMANYLNETYGDRYLIWNLSGTREYDTEPFENRVVNFPCGFVDFGTPTIDQLYRISYSLRWWIKSHPKHVRVFLSLVSNNNNNENQQRQIAVIHGKDDTVAVGVAVACYLIYSGICDGFLDALDIYLQRRHPKWKMDVTALPASYRRALINFHSIRELPNFSCQNTESSLFLNCIFVYNLPVLNKASSQQEDNKLVSSRPIPRLELFKGMKTIFSSSWDKESIMEWIPEEGRLVIRVTEDISGDVGVVCYNGESKASQMYFKFTAHVPFLNPGMLRISRSHLDMTKSVREAAKRSGMKMEFVICQSSRPDQVKRIEQDDEEFFDCIEADVPLGMKGSKAYRQGLNEISEHHCVPCDLRTAKSLRDMGHHDKPTDHIVAALQLSNEDVTSASHLLSVLKFDCEDEEEEEAEESSTSMTRTTSTTGEQGTLSSSSSPERGVGEVHEETKEVSPVRTMQSHFGKNADHMFRKYIAHMKALADCKSAEGRKKITDEMVREGLDPSVLSLLSSASKTFDISAHPSTSSLSTTTSSSSFPTTTKSTLSSFPVSELQNLTQRHQSQPQQRQQNCSSTTTNEYDTSAKGKKYSKMLKAGVPPHILKLRMERDGIDSDTIQRILSSAVVSTNNTKQSTKRSNVQENQNSKKLSNFSKMLKMGVPKGAVAARMIAAGLDPSTLCGPEFATDQKKDRDNKKGKDIKVKRLFWDALDEDDLMEKDTIWSQLDDDQEEEVVGVKNIHLDLDRMRSLFMKLPSPAKSSRLFKNKKRNKQRRRSMQEIRLVKHKRAHNVEIILSRLKLEASKIRDGIYSMDISENGLDVSIDLMNSIQTALPTDRDVTDIKSFGGDKRRLGAAERFFVDLSSVKIETLRKRLRLMMFRKDFTQRLGMVTEKIETCNNACSQVKDSRSLRVLLKTVIRLGNTLDELGGRTGGARGIRVKSLVELKRTKSFDKKTTLLDFLEMQMFDQAPNACQVHEELHSIFGASRVSIPGVYSEIVSLRKGIQDIKSEIKLIEKDMHQHKNWSSEKTQNIEHSVKSLQRFTTKSGSEVERAFEVFVSVREKFNDLTRWFGESDSMTSEDFFGTLHEFVLQFRDAHVKAQEIRHRNRVQEAINAARKSRASNRASRRTTTDQSGSLSPTKTKRMSLEIGLATRRALLGVAQQRRQEDGDDEESWDDDTPSSPFL